ncbi:MAG TPA: sulfotransferase [Thermodesulfovibrionales bacterium]|nr:sulfotransferase [Thermodesulfovibrionales bacterium]
MKRINKIFNIGFNKSGTTSLSAALNILGIRTIHYMHEGDRLIDIIRDNKKNNRKLLRGLEDIDGFSDFAGILFQELDKQYPNSKFILTIRDMDEWLASREKHVTRRKKDRRYRFEPLTVDREAWKKRRAEFVQQVSEYFKDRPSDLLIIDICAGEGWEKLCPFLGVPIPRVPFPHKNKSLRKAFGFFELLRLQRGIRRGA